MLSGSLCEHIIQWYWRSCLLKQQIKSTLLHMDVPSLIVLKNEIGAEISPAPWWIIAPCFLLVKEEGQLQPQRCDNKGVIACCQQYPLKAQWPRVAHNISVSLMQRTKTTAGLGLICPCSHWFQLNRHTGNQARRLHMCMRVNVRESNAIIIEWNEINAH